MTGLRLAIGLLTALPVTTPRVDRRLAGQAIVLAPLVGLGLGVAAAAVAEVCVEFGLGPLIVAVLAFGALAYATRALHLDGLADTVDALGSGKPAAAALAVMKRSDIGPFGVVALLFAGLLQVSALASAYASGHGAASLVVAVVAGRLALPLACRHGIQAAKPEGLGALVAGTVGRGGLATAVVVTLLVAAGAGTLSPLGLWRPLLAVALGSAAALVLLALCVRRFGGITGDVLGALVETATTVALLALA